MLGAGFVRVSTGSQDEASQVKDIKNAASQRGITIVRWFKLHGYSASAGAQEPALREAISDIERGDYTAIVVTDSSRLDRRTPKEQKATLLAIALAGGEVISITEPDFGKDDTLSGDVMTVILQHAAHEKSKTVKNSTYRGISMIRDNKAHHGALPSMWATKGARYSKQAYCTNPDAVADIYERVANGESLASIGRSYNLYPATIKNIIRYTASHTGVEECSYTHEGQTITWTHKVTPVVESPLWWRANKILDANLTDDTRGNKGGRPIAKPANWISGVLDCPSCGGKLYLNAGKTPQGNPRTPKLRCGGHPKNRLSCGEFKSCDAQPVIDTLARIFTDDTNPVLSYQRVAGNSHQLEELKASLSKIQARLSATENDDELDALVAERKTIKAAIEAFKIIPDSFDYAPTGQTISHMWGHGDDTVKRGMVRAIKTTGGISLTENGIRVTLVYPAKHGEIIDLGGGICYRRTLPNVLSQSFDGEA